MADKPMEILDVHIPCQTCGKLIPAGGNSHCLTCRVWRLRLKEIMPRWIPVTERLPEEGEDVLVFGYWHEKFQPLMCYLSPHRKGEWFTTVAGQQVYTVTHWMPLPEPPKEGVSDAE